LDAIVDAAARVFLERGYGAATIDQLAVEARTAKRTLYARFGDKAGLFAAVVQRLSDAVVSGFPAAPDPSRPVREELESFARRLLVLALSPGALGVYRLVVGEATRFPGLAEAFYDNGPGRGIAALTRYFEAMPKQPSGVEPALLAEQFFNASLSELHRRALLSVGEAPTKRQIDKQVHAAIELFERTWPDLFS
jgi:TetR/AcrR family transcriptional repressor of mexJK operon